MAIELMELPFPVHAFEPYMSRRTVDFHYGKHHRNYVNTLNTLISGTEYEEMILEEILVESSVNPEDRKIFNNAGQVWNHNFFWNGLGLDSGAKEKDHVIRRITENFESIQDFETQFFEVGRNLFGSGWVWVVRRNDGSIGINGASNAENPLLTGDHPILVCDVWEHAYYLDYQNDRTKFLSQFWKIINWNFVNMNLEKPNLHLTLPPLVDMSQ